ncbi:MAG: PQQ-binding-like beta-propeller repeat protein [Bacteroidetes bacterium]|nr:PQQ-binding-like beta-propeller repeat protein [Bacteroidota bacterium]
MRIERIIFVILLLTADVGYCQKNQIQVLSNEKVLGKSLVDSIVFKGMEYVFPDRIHETFLDTTTGLLTVQLRGLSKNGKWLDNSGKIIQFDIKNQKVLWSKNIVYEANILQQFNKTMIFSVGNKSSCLDIYTGEELWEVKNNIYFVDPMENIGLGYKFKNSSGFTNELEGIDLQNGNVLWKRDLNREYGWNDVFYTNDSTMIIVAAGLHSININTGKGWDYHSVTGKKDYKGTVGANAAGLALGLLTGAFAMSTGHNLVRDLVSNTIVDSSNIYFASKEQLVKIDKQSGEIAWKFSFPNDIASKSSLILQDNVIYMVNNGVAFMGYRQIDFGKPFFAAFDKQTGKQIFLTNLNVKDDPILSYEINNGAMYFVFKNRVAKYSMDTGNEILQKEFSKENFGELKYFVGGNVFITSQNGDLLNLHQSDSTKLFVFTNQSKTLSLDDQLSITKSIDFNEISIYYQRTKDFKFIAKDKNTLIVNNEGKSIAEVEATFNASITGNTLYDTQDKSFIIIDLNKIIENK